MVAWRASVKSGPSLLLLGVREPGQIEIEDDFIAQRNSVQIERAIAAFGRIKITNDMMEAKTLPLIELEGRNTGGSSRNDKALSTASDAVRGSLLHQRGADTGRPPSLFNGEALYLERARFFRLNNQGVADSRTIDPGDQHFAQVSIARDLIR